jgi:hypothetical protein
LPQYRPASTNDSAPRSSCLQSTTASLTGFLDYVQQSALGFKVDIATRVNTNPIPKILSPIERAALQDLSFDASISKRKGPEIFATVKKSDITDLVDDSEIKHSTWLSLIESGVIVPFSHESSEAFINSQHESLATPPSTTDEKTMEEGASQTSSAGKINALLRARLGEVGEVRLVTTEAERGKESHLREFLFELVEVAAFAVAMGGAHAIESTIRDGHRQDFNSIVGGAILIGVGNLVNAAINAHLDPNQFFEQPDVTRLDLGLFHGKTNIERAELLLKAFICVGLGVAMASETSVVGGTSAFYGLTVMCKYLSSQGLNESDRHYTIYATYEKMKFQEVYTHFSQVSTENATIQVDVRDAHFGDPLPFDSKELHDLVPEPSLKTFIHDHAIYSASHILSGGIGFPLIVGTVYQLAGTKAPNEIGARGTVLAAPMLHPITSLFRSWQNGERAFSTFQGPVKELQTANIKAWTTFAEATKLEAGVVSDYEKKIQDAVYQAVVKEVALYAMGAIVTTLGVILLGVFNSYNNQKDGNVGGVITAAVLINLGSLMVNLGSKEQAKRIVHLKNALGDNLEMIKKYTPKVESRQVEVVGNEEA